MKLYIKQKVFSWRDKFRVYDEFESDRYSVEGEVFTFGKKLHVNDMIGNEAAFIHQKVWSFRPRYFISQNGTDIAQVVREFSFLRPKYSVTPFGWTVNGNFTEHEYTITSGDETIATVSKRWLTWGDTYEIDITEGVNDVAVLCVVLIIDAVVAAQASAAAAASSSN